MNFAVITLFPEMISIVREFGVTGKAVKQGLIKINAWNPRDYTQDKHGSVDDRPYGGGPGMVMMMQPVSAAIIAAKQETGSNVKVIHLTPQGRKLDQAGVSELRSEKNLILLAGRYEGIDERLIESEVDEEWSIGDFVISGGELAALVMIDAITRTLPGVLGDDQSAVEDSFVSGLLDHPHYTRPEEFDNKRVPDILLSGNHEKIRLWRRKQALGRTWLRRPDLLEQMTLTDQEKQLLAEFQRESGLKI